MLKVLIVDDEPLVRRGIVLGVDWSARGCVVVGEAANGEEGLAAVERYSPNLIITDVRMPRMDGIEMMNRLPGPCDRAYRPQRLFLRPQCPSVRSGRLPSQALPGSGADGRH